MRLSIERLRTLVLVAGILLLALIVVALALGKWKRRFIKTDIPQRLGLNITQEANGFTFSHALGSHSQYKIHAARVEQLNDNRARLHDVTIELFDNDGKRVDRIVGAEFEYNQDAGTARADGAVEITMMRPGSAPSVAPRADAIQAGKGLAKPLTAVAQNAASGEIHVKTSGLYFDRQTGRATTDKRVDFSTNQGKGNAIGAVYDSLNGLLTLDHSVEMITQHDREAITLHAQHAEFERNTLKCNLRSASLATQSDQATAGQATILFREDGSAIQLDATTGFSMTTSSGSHIEAPSGHLEFDERNQPRHGRLEGGVTMLSHNAKENISRNLRGTAPTAQLEFDAKGTLHSAHLERGVEMRDEEARNGEQSSRSWKSPVADLQFHDAGGRVELASVHGSGGVVVASESRKGQTLLPSRMSADQLTAQLTAGESLSTLVGVGHAHMEQTSANGNQQSTSGDRLEAHFLPGGSISGRNLLSGSDKKGATANGEIQSAVVDGHVTLSQQPAPKQGASAALHAWANRAVWEGGSEVLHLTGSPRVENGGLQMSAARIDVSQSSGDAWAHGNVKASWTGNGSGSSMFGGSTPVHAISSEAQLHQSTGEVTFRGQARLWQDANSVLAPVVVLNRIRQTMTAHAQNGAEPVRLTLLSTNGKDATKSDLIRLRGGDLRYSDNERRALLEAGSLSSVTAETSLATSSSREMELILLPAGKGSGQLDRMIARGHVALTTEGRRGIGEQLIYTSRSGEYVLTGTSAIPPHITDAAHGSISGEAIHFFSHDDSVTVEGGRSGTHTETRTPR